MPDKLPDLWNVDLDTLDSPTLARLIDEVRQDLDDPPVAYNRIHNRHNRGGTNPRPTDPDDNPRT